MYGDDDEEITKALQRMSSYSPDPRDTAMQDRWREEEGRTLGRLESGDEYGIGQLLRDILPGAIGITGDAITNNGKGVADIAAQMGAQAAANYANDQKRQMADREYALKQREQREKAGGGSAFDRAYKTANALSEQRRIALATQNAGYRGDQLEQGERRTKLAEDAHSYNYNPEDSRAIALVDDLIANGMSEDARGLPTKALTDRAPVTKHEVDHSFAPTTRDDKAKETVATTAAREGTELQFAPAKADAAADATRKTTTARINTEGDLAPVTAKTKAAEAAGSTTGRLGAEGDVAEEGFIAPLARAEVDPERVRLLARDPKVGKQARDELEASGELVSLLDDMVDVREKEAQGLAKPGSYRSFFDASRVRLEGLIARGNDMGVLNTGDRQAVGSFLGASSAGWLDLSGLLGGDVKLDQLKGVREAFTTADRRAGQKWGYGEFGSAPTQTTPRQVDRPASRSGAPAGGPSRPSSSSAAPAASGMVTIRLGSDTRQVPADQAKRLKAINPALEVF